jgi:hypothetical protein
MDIDFIQKLAIAKGVTFIKNVDQIENPDWEHCDKCHDWKNHVGDSIIEIWDTFTIHQKIAIVIDAQQRADQEEWD